MNTATEYLNKKELRANSKPTSFLGLRARLLLGFAAIMGIFLLQMFIMIPILYSTNEFAKNVNTVNLPSYDTLIDLNNNVFQARISLAEWLITNDPKDKIEVDNAWNNIAIFTASIEKLLKNTPEEIGGLWVEIKPLLEQLKIAQQKVIAASDKVAAVAILRNEVIPLTNQVSNKLNNFNAAAVGINGILDLISLDLKKNTEIVMEKLSILQAVEYSLSILGIIFAILIAMFTARSILRHVNIFRQHSGRIASGDLTQYISVEGTDELGQLGGDLNIMTESLATISKQITEACHNMLSTLDEVRHAVDSQSAGATEQAASINEITASLSEIEKSAAQTMEKAKNLGSVAERTREKGQLGLEAVEQSVQGMKDVREKVQVIAQTILELSNQTQQVGEITSVVNNLAQQSKMLALNASIEAAKAGEAGKGFAVVAVEVKNLAEQSEQSTEQVQKILEDIRQATEKAVMVTEEGTKGVDHGTSLVEQTGEIIRNLNDVIHEATLASQQIEAAVRQEGAGIEQITAGMNEINQVTAAFVESVKQTTEAMTNLSTIAKNLKTYVDSYKV